MQENTFFAETAGFWVIFEGFGKEFRVSKFRNSSAGHRPPEKGDGKLCPVLDRAGPSPYIARRDRRIGNLGPNLREVLT
jgi:hypothetical protein